MNSNLDLSSYINLLNFKKQTAIGLYDMSTDSQQTSPNQKLQLKDNEFSNKFDDLSQNMSRIGFQKLSLSAAYSNKKIIVDDISTGFQGFNSKKAITTESQASSPDRDFNRQEFFTQFRLPILQDISNSSSQCFDNQPFDEELPYKQKLEYQERNAVKYIEPQVLNERILYELNNPEEKKLQIYDCRYQFEFNNGHISEAIPMSNPLEIQNQFFQNVPKLQDSPIIVLYCEFSEKRSIKIYNQIRSQDRNQNEYPNLFYPDMYVLDKGFSNYFNDFQQQCEGQYVQMLDKNYEKELKTQSHMNTSQWHQLKFSRRKHTLK